MYACMHACMQVEGLCMCVIQKSVLGVFLNYFPSCFLEMGWGMYLLLNLELADSTSLAGWQASGICLSPPPWCWDYRCVLS